MRALRPMTQEEREFAEQKHDLVIKFLRRRCLPMEDFYDVAIFGYLSAVQRYIRDQPTGVPFEALAIRGMKDALHQNREYNARAKRNGYTDSLDDMTWFHVGAIPDTRHNIQREIERKDLLERAAKIATPSEVPIIRLLIDGYRLGEAASLLRISKGAASVRMQRFYRRARAAIG